MAVMGVVQTSLHQIADMIAVGHGFMAATRTVDMIVAMAERAVGERRAIAGIGVADFDHMLVHMVFMGVMKMAVMKIVHMVAMLDGSVAAARAVNMVVVGMFGIVAGHFSSPFMARLKPGLRRRDR